MQVSAADFSANASDNAVRWRENLRHALTMIAICLAMVGVFAFDIYTPPDDVSICFIYAFLVSLSALSHPRAPYICAALGTVLSLTGAFIQPPYDELSVVFFTNRAIAIAAQWLVAFLVILRRNSELRTRADFMKERAKAETSRRFVDVLTHEIGTSLTTVDGQAFRLKKILATNATDDAMQRVDKIRQAAKHIESVLRQVQVASEIEQGALEIARAPVNLADIIAETVVEVADNHPVNIDTGQLPPAVHGNADMLQQVITNLLSNAVKYSPTDAPISIWGRTNNTMAVVSVSDRGRGIPEDELNKLFDPYFRASNSRGVHGTGIGLYVVRQYIENHGGTIDVTSELGSWTTVTFEIPVGPPSETPS